MIDADERYQIFTGLISSISRSIQKIKNAEMANFGLKGKQVQCLFSLYSLPDGASMSQLCELCDEDKAAMYRTVQELTDKDLVYTDETSTKKYKKPIKLTSRGQEMAQIVVDKIADITGLSGSTISEPERQILYTSLAQIAANLNKICQTYQS